MSSSPSLSATCALALGLAISAAPPLQAQPRFELIGHDTVVQVGGLTIDTIRDRQLSVCYALFTMEPPAAAASAAGLKAAPSPVERVASGPADWSTLPYTTPTPGTPTGGWEYMAESVRLAMVHPSTTAALVEPVSDRLNDVIQELDRISRLLASLALAPRVMVLPASCDTALPR